MALFSKKSPVVPTAAPALPACTLTRDGQTLALDAEASALLHAAWDRKRQVDEAKADLDAMNARLLEAYGPGCTLEIPGQAKLTLTERASVRIADPHTLKALLGGRFDDLVNTRIEYTTSDKLKELLADADHPLSDAVRSCCTFGASSSVTYRPVKP